MQKIDVIMKQWFMPLLAALMMGLPVVRAAETCGSSWQWANPKPQGNPLTSVIYAAGKYVAVGDFGTIMTSTNGSAWTVRTSGTFKHLNGIARSATQFVAVGDGGTILTSPDGVTWTARTSGVTNALLAVTWGGNKFVATAYGNYPLTSPDGITWTQGSSGDNFNSVTWGGNQFIATYYYGSAIYTSPDGITWTQRTSNVSGDLNSVTWNGSKLVAVGYSYGGLAPIATSTDGITWTAQSSGTTNGLSGVVWNGTQFVAVGGLGTVLTSPDGVTWTAQDASSTNRLWSVTWSGSQLVAVGSGGAILTSPNAETWTVRAPTVTSAHLSAVAWGNGKFVAVGYSPTVFTSADGLTWTTRNLGTDTYKLDDVIWGGNQFVAVGYYLGYQSIIFTSPDGITWTERYVDGYYSLFSVTRSSNQFVTVGDDGKIFTSPDAVTWTKRTSGTTVDLYGVTWGNNQFVAVGNPRASVATILTSADGVTWTARNSGTTNNLQSVTWNGTQFVAVGDNGTILTSPSGAAWTARSSGVTEYLLKVTWNGSQFMVVGADYYPASGSVLTSPDGITWNVRNQIGSELYGVTWNGTQFVTVGENGSILTATCFLPPTISAVAGNGQVTLNWNAVTGAASYNVYQGTTPGGEATTPVRTGLTVAPVTITGLTNGSRYYFKMASVKAGGTVSPLSNEVSAIPTLPLDFVATGLTPTPYFPAAGSTFSAAVTVKNQGSGAGNGGQLTVWADKASAAVCSATGDQTRTVGSLTAGQSQTINVTGLIAGTSGIKTLRAFIDSTCATAETNEANNQFTYSYRVTGRKPDFVVTALTITPANPVTTGNVTLSVTVKNQGSLAGSGGYLDVWTNQATAQTCGAGGNAWADVDSLAAGASKTFTFTLPAGAAGAKTARAFVDSWCETQELNDGNNQMTKAYTVTTPIVITLGLSPTSLSFGNQMVNTTSAAKTVTLSNHGTGAATGISVAVTGNYVISGGTCGHTLAAATNCTIGVTFRPTAAGSSNGTLSITSSNATTVNATLTGTGIVTM